LLQEGSHHGLTVAALVEELNSPALCFRCTGVTPAWPPAASAAELAKPDGAGDDWMKRRGGDPVGLRPAVACGLESSMTLKWIVKPNHLGT
jgi:hypothetical protein